VLFTDDHESIPFVFGILRTKAGTATYTVRRALNGGDVLGVHCQDYR
jgi:hypothetical protein